MSHMEERKDLVAKALGLIRDPRMPHARPPRDFNIYACVDWSRVLSTLVATGDVHVKPELRNDGSVYGLELTHINGLCVPPELDESALSYADEDDVNHPEIACQLMELYLALSDEVRHEHLLTGVKWEKVLHKLKDAKIITTAEYGQRVRGVVDEYVTTIQGAKPSEMLIRSALGKSEASPYQTMMAKQLLQLFSGAVHDPVCPSLNACREQFR